MPVRLPVYIVLLLTTYDVVGLLQAYKLCVQSWSGSLRDVKQTVTASYTETIFMLGTNNFALMVTGQVVDSQWLYLAWL